MTNPYRISEGEPAVISFSGGRTSGYLLWETIMAYGGTLPPWVSAIVARYPEKASWWAEQEAWAATTDRATTFRTDRPTYAAMIEAVKKGEALNYGIFDDLTSCASYGCTD